MWSAVSRKTTTAATPILSLEGAVGCFSFNEAAEELEKHGEEALPAIEQVLRNRVMSDISADEQERWRAYPGLMSLLVAYCTITKSSNVQRAATFLAPLHGPLLREALSAVRSAWENPVPEPLMSVIREIVQHGAGQNRETALEIVNYHKGMSKPRKEDEEVLVKLGFRKPSQD